MRTTSELKESFFELKDKQDTYKRVIDELDVEKGQKPPILAKAEKDFKDHFEKLQKELKDRSESDNPPDQNHTQDRPFVLDRDEIKYHDGDNIIKILKPPFH